MYTLSKEGAIIKIMVFWDMIVYILVGMLWRKLMLPY
jgi:hypothetical protein